MTADTGTFLAGVHDIPEAEYFAASHALSCSGAKLLLPPSCPARFFWQQDHPDQPVRKEVFDFGSAAHRLVLGAGRDITVLDFDSWHTRASKEAREAAYAEGSVPLLRDDYVQVSEMAEVIRRHPVASALFDAELGRPEQSLFWQDPDTSVPLRARVDWLRDRAPGRLIIPDYKTASSADPETFAKSAANYLYHLQDAWYGDGARALGLDEDPAFVFVVQEKTPPYLVTVIELDEAARRAGRELSRRAIATYQACTESGEWPGYSSGIELISLPPWARSREDYP